MSRYTELLKDPRWQKKRLEIMQRDEFSCKCCKSKESTLNVHHLKYAHEPWDVDNNYLITLCNACHTIIHSYSEIEIVSEGALSPFDFLLLDPILVTASLCYLENHKGDWIIKFRKNANPFNVIEITCMLYKFITRCDCTIKVRIDCPRIEGYSNLYTDIDIYEFLHDLKQC